MPGMSATAVGATFCDGILPRRSLIGGCVQGQEYVAVTGGFDPLGSLRGVGDHLRQERDRADGPVDVRHELAQDRCVLLLVEVGGADVILDLLKATAAVDRGVRRRVGGRVGEQRGGRNRWPTAWANAAVAPSRTAGSRGRSAGVRCQLPCSSLGRRDSPGCVPVERKRGRKPAYLVSGSFLESATTSWWLPSVSMTSLDGVSRLRSEQIAVCGMRMSLMGVGATGKAIRCGSACQSIRSAPVEAPPGAATAASAPRRPGSRMRRPSALVEDWDGLLGLGGDHDLKGAPVCAVRCIDASQGPSRRGTRCVPALGERRNPSHQGRPRTRRDVPQLKPLL